ncbi:ABC transporter permease [Halobacterium bonnevillei]|uniref:ABC transporter permease subunit n=1 Tax=Halobacterium bonnevillei TaxID=2692200 RepID=A0A6B0SLC6_9EURY|nr:ABC transporter permease [Halobacterium bonnevillei]MXR21286.1 ABC transporter permease subunit [Halobacterium bonnevillei]
MSTGRARLPELKDAVMENDWVRFLVSPGLGIGWVFLFLFLPMTVILVISFSAPGDFGNVIYEFTLENYQRFWNADVYKNIIFESLVYGFVVTLLSLPLGYTAGYFLGRSKTDWKWILLGLVVLQYWVPFIIRTYAWIIVLSNNGVLNQLLLSLGVIGSPLNIMYTNFSMILGLTVSLLPFMILPVYVSVSAIEEDQIHAAKTLGATDFRAFREITLPQSLPGIVSGVLFVFIISAGAFLAPTLLGGPNTRMIAPVIETVFILDFNWPFAAALSIIYFAIIAFLLYLFTRRVDLEEALETGAT